MDLVLVPGLWLTGDTWQEVVPPLQAEGHRAHPVTVPGTGSGDPAAVTLEECVAAVLGAVPGEGPVVLVGHSATCGLVWAAADAAVDRVAGVVLVAGFPTPDGEAPAAGLPERDGVIPAPEVATTFDAAELRDTDPARLQALCVPSPGCLATEPVRLTDERRYDVPVTVVSTEYPTEQLHAWRDAGEPSLAELTRMRRASYVDLPTGHWPQLTRPADLAALLATVATGLDATVTA